MSRKLVVTSNSFEKGLDRQLFFELMGRLTEEQKANWDESVMKLKEGNIYLDGSQWQERLTAFVDLCETDARRSKLKDEYRGVWGSGDLLGASGCVGWGGRSATVKSP